METSRARPVTQTDDVIFTKYHVTTLQELDRRYATATAKHDARHDARQDALAAELHREEKEARLIDAVATMREYCDNAALPLLTRGGTGAVAELLTLVQRPAPQ